MMPRFDAEESLRLIEKYKVTHSQWVPTMFIRMLKLEKDQQTAYDSRPTSRDPCRSALSSRSKTANDRLVGTNTSRVLRGVGAERVDADHQ